MDTVTVQRSNSSALSFVSIGDKTLGTIEKSYGSSRYSARVFVDNKPTMVWERGFTRKKAIAFLVEYHNAETK